MAATQHVTLMELLEVQDDAISEISGWSLLCQSAVTLLESNKSMPIIIILRRPLQRRITTIVSCYAAKLHTTHAREHTHTQKATIT